MSFINRPIQRPLASIKHIHSPAEHLIGSVIVQNSSLRLEQRTIVMSVMLRDVRSRLTLRKHGRKRVTEALPVQEGVWIGQPYLADDSVPRVGKAVGGKTQDVVGRELEECVHDGAVDTAIEADVPHVVPAATPQCQAGGAKAEVLRLVQGNDTVLILCQSVFWFNLIIDEVVTDILYHHLLGRRANMQLNH